MKVTISHPHGNANSYQAALALSEQKWLSSFKTGLIRKSQAAGLFRYLPADIRERLSNRSQDEIPDSDKHSHIAWEAISRLGSKLKPAGPTSQVSWYDVLFCGHDFQASKTLESGLDAVYAYEDGARWTFSAAKRRDITTIYELPLGHYLGVATEINRARKQLPGLQIEKYEEPHWKQARKDMELELADLIIVPCAWAAESLRYSKTYGKKPIIKIPYGTPTDLITARTSRPGGPFTVLFAGQVGLRKGIPFLVEAWEKLGLKDARLWLAGSLNLDRNYLAEHSTCFDYLGALPRVRLLEVMRETDLLVFPSLAEGFGLVIGEAMACGVPVLTTINTGGPELIENSREGWCVQAHSSEALIECIEWAYNHRDELYEMGQLARRKAEQWTWTDYRRRLIRELSLHLGVANAAEVGISIS